MRCLAFNACKCLSFDSWSIPRFNAVVSLYSKCAILKQQTFLYDHHDLCTGHYIDSTTCKTMAVTGTKDKIKCLIYSYAWFLIKVNFIP